MQKIKVSSKVCREGLYGLLEENLLCIQIQIMESLGCFGKYPHLKLPVSVNNIMPNELRVRFPKPTTAAVPSNEIS